VLNTVTVIVRIETLLTSLMSTVSVTASFGLLVLPVVFVLDCSEDAALRYR
jgi:hypothetical protein